MLVFEVWAKVGGRLRRVSPAAGLYSARLLAERTPGALLVPVTVAFAEARAAASSPGRVDDAVSARA